MISPRSVSAEAPKPFARRAEDLARDLRRGGWLGALLLVSATWTFAACSDEPGAAPADAGAPETATGAEGIATPANFKVAFIGDTAAGSDFKSVLQLIKREKAQAVLVQGDLTYSGDTAADWFPVADGELEPAQIPYFVARGNHDIDWEKSSGLGAGLEERLTKWGIEPEHNKPSMSNYAVVYKGLKMVFVDETETDSPRRADYVTERLEGDKHIWKICSWHKNQRASNAGPKTNEMGWQIYENCRAAGAIVAQGHSHTYSRSKTILEDSTQTLDQSCADPFALCVGPGKHFFFDSSLGGVDQRSLQQNDLPHWASTYASDFGALFIEFNVDGDPRKARGYFKTVGDEIIDPPASSGLDTFTITSTN